MKYCLVPLKYLTGTVPLLYRSGTLVNFFLTRTVHLVTCIPICNFVPAGVGRIIAEAKKLPIVLPMWLVGE